MWANDLVGSEISWWFPNILPLESGLIGMVPKNPATRARINRNGSYCSGSEISCDTGHARFSVQRVSPQSASFGPQSFLWASTGLGHVRRLKSSKVGQDCRMWLAV